ncbi:MAG: L-threonine 3-dehydrogenase, partial [Spirochaetota bacterium]
LNIHGITGRRIWDTWYKMKGLFASGNLDVAKVITHRMPFDAYEEGFKIMQSRNCGKVVLDL